MSTLNDSDIFLYQTPEGNTGRVTNSNRSNLDDNDYFLVQRTEEGVTTTYRVASQFVGGDPAEEIPPAITDVNLDQDQTNANRFTSNSFTTTITNVGGPAVTTTMTAQVTGEFAALITTNSIATNNYPGTSSESIELVLDGNTNLEFLTNGTSVTSSEQYTPTTSNIETVVTAQLTEERVGGESGQNGGAFDGDLDTGEGCTTGSTDNQVTWSFYLPNVARVRIYARSGGNGSGGVGVYYANDQEVGRYTMPYTVARWTDWTDLTSDVLTSITVSCENPNSTTNQGILVGAVEVEFEDGTTQILTEDNLPTNYNIITFDDNTDLNLFQAGDIIQSPDVSVVSVDVSANQMVVDGGAFGSNYNMSQDWYLQVSASPASSLSPYLAFDGNPDTRLSTASTSSASIDWSCPLTGVCVAKVACTQVQINGSTVIDNLGSGDQIVTFNVNAGDTVRFYRAGGSIKSHLYYIEIDGQMLVSPMRYDREWSDGVDLVNDATVEGNGAFSPYKSKNDFLRAGGGTQNQVNITFDPPIPFTTLEFVGDSGIAGSKWEINGQQQTVGRTSGTYESKRITYEGPDTQLETIEIAGTSNGVGRLYGVYIDGLALTDTSDVPWLDVNGDEQVSTLSPKQGNATVASVNGSTLTLQPFTDNCFPVDTFVQADLRPRITPVVGDIISSDIITDTIQLSSSDSLDLIPADNQTVFMCDVDGNAATAQISTTTISDVQGGNMSGAEITPQRALSSNRVNNFTNETWEFWFRLESNNSGACFWSQKQSSTFGANDAVIQYHSGAIRAESGSSNSAITVPFTPDGQWHHYALVSEDNSSTVSAYLDGELIDQKTNFTWSHSRQQDCRVLVRQGSSNKRYYSGGISNFRLSDSVRYTDSFTPPTQDFVSDSNTIFLLFQGDTDYTTDHSGNKTFSTIGTGTAVVTSDGGPGGGPTTLTFPGDITSNPNLKYFLPDDVLSAGTERGTTFDFKFVPNSDGGDTPRAYNDAGSVVESCEYGVPLSSDGQSRNMYFDVGSPQPNIEFVRYSGNNNNNMRIFYGSNDPDDANSWVEIVSNGYVGNPSNPVTPPPMNSGITPYRYFLVMCTGCTGTGLNHRRYGLWDTVTLSDATVISNGYYADPQTNTLQVQGGIWDPSGVNGENVATVQKSGAGHVESVNVENRTITLSYSNDQWIDGYYVSTGPIPTLQSNAYLIFDGDGNVTDFSDEEQTPVSMNNLLEPTLTFPASFESTDTAPDAEFADTRSSLQTSVTVTNGAGSSDGTSNALAPEFLGRSTLGAGEIYHNCEGSARMAANIASKDIREATKRLIDAKETASETYTRLKNFVDDYVDSEGY